MDGTSLLIVFKFITNYLMTNERDEACKGKRGKGAENEKASTPSLTTLQQVQSHGILVYRSIDSMIVLIL